MSKRLWIALGISLCASAVFATVSASTFLDFGEIGAPAAPAAGTTRLYADSTGHNLQVSLNGGTFRSVATPTSLGTATQVLHGAPSGGPTFGAVAQGDVTSGYVDLANTQTVGGAKLFSSTVRADTIHSNGSGNSEIVLETAGSNVIQLTASVGVDFTDNVSNPYATFLPDGSGSFQVPAGANTMAWSATALTLAGTLHSTLEMTFHSLSSFAGTLLVTNTTYDALQLDNLQGATITAVTGFVSSAGTGAGSVHWQISDGTNTCDCAVACTTAGAFRQGSCTTVAGAGCVFPTSAIMTLKTKNAADCSPYPTLKTLHVMGNKG